jgi:hypothetical protein
MATPRLPGPILNRGEPAERRRPLWEFYRQPDITPNPNDPNALEQYFPDQAGA